MRIYEYYINLNERGDFYADVRDQSGVTVYELRGFDILEDGFMADIHDVTGLAKYLMDLGFIPTESVIEPAN